jgi:preprotein translocase subunit SecB
MEVKFQITHIRLAESHFSINREYKWEKDKPVELENRVEINFKQADKKLQLLLSVSSNSEKQPFRFSVVYEGIFTFEKIPKKNELERIAKVNCAAIIFPYAREYIAEITRRAGLQPLNLPPFNFFAAHTENQKDTPLQVSRKPRKKIKEE